MKIKLNKWTDPEGNDHYITSFHLAGELFLSFRTYEVKVDGKIGPGPLVPFDQMPGQPGCRVEEDVEAEVVFREVVPTTSPTNSSQD